MFSFAMLLAENSELLPPNRKDHHPQESFDVPSQCACSLVPPLFPSGTKLRIIFLILFNVFSEM
jgi:hypothetical protein